MVEISNMGLIYSNFYHLTLPFLKIEIPLKGQKFSKASYVCRIVSSILPNKGTKENCFRDFLTFRYTIVWLTSPNTHIPQQMRRVWKWRKNMAKLNTYFHRPVVRHSFYFLLIMSSKSFWSFYSSTIHYNSKTFIIFKRECFIISTFLQFENILWIVHHS